VIGVFGITRVLDICAGSVTPQLVNRAMVSAASGLIFGSDFMVVQCAATVLTISSQVVFVDLAACDQMECDPIEREITAGFSRVGLLRK
jgi:hypothetical protein